ncbi:MAG: type II toxin-antitoxin system HicB family antitoxin [Deltaproteobacteria bacterium]|nr:type II toxin-antitoxin system HicB family antitoxin [Deltaproteobacteria bacterium]
MQVTFVVKLPATVKKKGRFYISCCPILDVYSQGETEGKALRNLKEALKLFFISCFDRGTLDEVLKNCGFKPIEKRVVKVQPFPKKYRSVQVPLPFKAPQKVDPALCHA